MDLELVTVGNELILGFTQDSNARDLARTLAACGARVRRKTTVADEHDAIRSAVAGALARTGFVITTGGLGPTRDDVTKPAVAEIFDAPLELDLEYLRELEKRFETLGRTMSPTNRSQAEVPRGALRIPNPHGTAPGLWLEGPPGVAVMLPGVPREVHHILREELIPRIQARLRRPGRSPESVTLSRSLRTTGVPESTLAERLDGIEETLGPVTLAFLPGVYGVDLRLTCWSRPRDEAEALLEEAARRLRAPIGTDLYGEGDQDLAGVLLERLAARRWSLAVAESCTGGMLGERITAVPGSSRVFRGGIIAYSDESKVRELGVAASLIEQRGAVSEEVVAAMAAGVAARFDTAAALAVSGVAGPGGGTPEKPVGTVCLAAQAQGRTRTRRIRLHGDRDEIRQRSAQAALSLLSRTLDDPA